MDIQSNILHIERAGSGAPLVLLHGFTGSTATWAQHLPVFAQQRSVVAVDLIGHGQSATPADPTRYTMERCVADLVALLDALELPTVNVLGYSLGGRVALHLAVAARERVHALVLESASPGLATAAEREARIAADNELAGFIEREGMAAFVDRWERVPLFASQAALSQSVQERQHNQRLQNNPRGLANSLRGMGTGRQASLWERLPTLDLPTLLVVGALDAKFCRIADVMEAQLPNARRVVVADAGHAVHLEQPTAFAKTVVEFLDSHTPQLA